MSPFTIFIIAAPVAALIALNWDVVVDAVVYLRRLLGLA